MIMEFDFKKFADFCKKVYKINLEIINAGKYYDKMWNKANKYLQNTFNKKTKSEYKLSGLCVEMDPFNSETSIDTVIITGELKRKLSKGTGPSAPRCEAASGLRRCDVHSRSQNPANRPRSTPCPGRVH